jgi:uncharacterized membrane protein
MASATTDHPLERLVFFSDAVFAIAITLLVIEIHIPHVESGAPDLAYWAALAQLIPNFVGYAVSFGVIGVFWAGHHRAFCLAGRYQGRAARWNLVFLGAIAFIPFVTGFTSMHPGARVPALVYWTWLLLTALLNLRVCSIATSPPMLANDVSPQDAADVPRRSLSVVLGAATSLAMGFFAPYVAPAAMATIPLWRLLLVRIAKSASPAE